MWRKEGKSIAPSLRRIAEILHLAWDVMMLFCRWHDGGPQPLWGDFHLPERNGVPGVLGGTTVGNHVLRQLWSGHADSLPVHHTRGLDRYALLGEWRLGTFYLAEKINIFISLENSGFLGSLHSFGRINPERIVSHIQKSLTWCCTVAIFHSTSWE